MKHSVKHGIPCGLLVGWLVLLESLSAVAQIVPDATLPVNSSVSPGCTVCTIADGTVRGVNLFHSFREFSVPTGGVAWFNNDLPIQNIFTRVTGTTVSNIDGLIRANGTANLFLLNPNGVLFGPNAQLQVGGSFLATTSDRFQFFDGSEFSAANPQAPPLLTVNLTPGLQLGRGQSPITNNGRLEVATGEALTLLGSNITSTGSLIAPGGKVEVLGDRVSLLDWAQINVSSPTGGGTVLVGGGFQGQGNVPSATHTYIASNVTIHADALQTGNGGRVIIWADETTGFYGTVTARGGFASGNGGFVEVSGKEALKFAGLVNTLAPNGQVGTLLLDPKNIVIQLDGTAPFGQTFDTNPADTSFISGAALSTALITSAVTLQANNDITVNSNITGTANNLTLQAGRSITIGAGQTIVLNGGNFSARINDENAIVSDRDPGVARFIMNPNAQILTDGGNITIDHGTFSGLAVGEILLNQATINSGTGNILMVGKGGADGAGNSSIGLSGIFNNGILLFNSSFVESTGIGEITLRGTGGSSQGDANYGVVLGDGMPFSIIRSQDGNINVFGTGGDNPAVLNDDGINIGITAVVESTGRGNITLTGTGGAGSDSQGIAIGSRSRVASNNGNIAMTGTANGAESLNSTSNGNNGILMYDGGRVESIGQGNITLIGLGSNGNGLNNTGIQIQDTNSRVSSFSGSITLSGTGGNGNGEGNNSGIWIVGTNSGVSSVNGNITLMGNGGNGNSVNYEGILIRGERSGVSSVNGNINLIGNTGYGNISSSQGIELGDLAVVESTGSGNITLEGTANATGFINNGIFIGDGDSRVSSTDGTIHLVGISYGVEGTEYGIYLRGGGLIEAKGRGSITLEGSASSGIDGIRVENGSISGVEGNILLTSESVSLLNGGRIRNQTFGTGDAGNITINTRQLLIQNAQPGSTLITGVGTETFGSGRGGDLLVNASESIAIVGNRPGLFTPDPNDPASVLLSVATRTGLTTATLSSGQAGNLTINTWRFNIRDGAGVTTSSLSPEPRAGNGGELRVIATGAIDFQGLAGLTTSTLGPGNAGNLIVEADGPVTLRNGAVISADTVVGSSGNAGNLQITTPQLQVLNGSRIGTATAGTGRGGDLVLNTGQLLIANGGQITTSGSSQGAAGNLVVTADAISMNDRALLRASTQVGIGGNIDLRVADSIFLRNGSEISAEAFGSANGGNIRMDVGNFVLAILSEDSDVIAKAFAGNGGRIFAKATGVFGFRLYTGQDTPESDFVASSDLGIDGVVTVDTEDQLEEPPPLQLVDPTTLLRVGCTPGVRSPMQRGSRQPPSFVITGRGGLPPNPTDPLSSGAVLTADGQPFEPAIQGYSRNRSIDRPPNTLIEAQGWVMDADGTVILVAQIPQVSAPQPWQPSPDCRGE